MKSIAVIFSLLLLTMITASAAEPDTRVFEMRTYYAAPGKLEDLHARFRNFTTRLFEKHGISNVGYWTPIENPGNKLIYILAYPSREARENSWKDFQADEEWKKAKADSEVNGKLVDKVDSIFLTALPFSPEIKPSTGAADRVFELRTYTTTPGNLPALHNRFRDHTIALFAKHGMTNFGYWQLMPDQPGADITLIYLLAHANEGAAKLSFEAFRADPDWVAAKKESEDKAGGSLTIPDGVVSVFLKPTPYSPTR